MDPLRRRLPALLAGLVLVGVGCGDDEEGARRTPATTATAPGVPVTPPVGDDEAERIGREVARRRFGVPARGTVTVLRSDRDPRWVLVDGGGGRRLWAVWLRNGRVAFATDDVREFDPPQVPCDLRPAFSEPSC